MSGVINLAGGVPTKTEGTQLLEWTAVAAWTAERFTFTETEASLNRGGISYSI